MLSSYILIFVFILFLASQEKADKTVCWDPHLAPLRKDLVPFTRHKYLFRTDNWHPVLENNLNKKNSFYYNYYY